MPLAKHCNQYNCGVPIGSALTPAQVPHMLRFFASLIAHAEGCGKPRVMKFLREYALQRKTGQAPVTKVCPGCGDSFVPHRAGQIYCTRGRGGGVKDCRYLHMRRLRMEAKYESCYGTEISRLKMESC